ncbi:uncharacterized protein LOC130798559 [Amaranthus tricolor]|uniref:uncharacterized protein LOC130798559 n=1 Tax=Amaranthus tricolor TaxID=29722 RepID=UPI00258CD9D2|nr:uncharacterized protein LOC130798559 [Amaranthus tricolor]
MPLSMKIQPIDAAGDDEILVNEPVKPVVKSRLKRLFRISVSEPVPPPLPASAEVFEPSSVCLAKMVQNFIEESNEKVSQSPAVRCTKNRCNCFNGNGSDGSDGESDNNNTVSSADVCDFLKSLVVCASLNERNVLADTAKIVAEKKTSKRKDELKKIVTDGLLALGYDSAICKSKWEKSPSFPAGEYEYVDVIVGGERLIIDIDFRSEFEVARSTKAYKSILQALPHIFVGKSDRLSKIICILSEAAKQSLKKKGMHIPPWRKVDYVQAKWLSPPTRITSASATATPPPSPLSPTSFAIDTDLPSPDKATGCDNHTANESKLSQSSPSSESIFDMSESSGEEEVKEKENNKPNKGSAIGVKLITGLTSIMEEKEKP